MNTKHLLIVEDENFNREFYADLFRRHKYRVTTAENGLEALKVLKKKPCDLVLLDLIMPELDGIGVLNAIKKDPPKVKHGPIYVFTVLGQPEKLREAEKLGAEGYIIKSDVSPDELISKVKIALEKDAS